jgi:hypothetical protein
MIETLRTNLATAQSEWTTQVGDPILQCNPKNIDGRWKSVYEPAAAVDNMVIYEVTELIMHCLTYLENIKAVLPDARVEVHDRGAFDARPKAEMEAMRGLLAEWVKMW